LRARGEVIRSADLSADLLSGLLSSPAGTLDERLDSYEASEILKTLESTAGNRSAAARMLGLKRTTLIYRIRKLGLR
jgi:transcriptional regulator of acetoin/glycerol metabolism